MAKIWTNNISVLKTGFRVLKSAIQSNLALLGIFPSESSLPLGFPWPLSISLWNGFPLDLIGPGCCYLVTSDRASSMQCFFPSGSSSVVSTWWWELLGEGHLSVHSCSKKVAELKPALFCLSSCRKVKESFTSNLLSVLRQVHPNLRPLACEMQW